MRIKFLQNVNISNKVTIFKNEEYEAREDGDYIMIRIEDDRTIKAPKSEIEGIIEILVSEEV